MYIYISLYLSFSGDKCQAGSWTWVQLGNPVPQTLEQLRHSGEGQKWGRAGGVTANCMFLTDLSGTPFDLLVFPKLPGRTVFPNPSKLITFAAAPLVSTPFVSQPRHRAAEAFGCKDGPERRLNFLLVDLRLNAAKVRREPKGVLLKGGSALSCVSPDQR